VPRPPIIALPDALPHTSVAPARADAGSRAGGRGDLRDDDLHDLLVAFYAAVANDPLLAPYFVALDMGAHMPQIVAFWSTMLFHTGRYSGNAFRPHQSMPGLTAEHFGRWVATLERTVDARFAGEHAGRMKDLAHRIAYSTQLRLGITPPEDYRPGG
jgi:hemoglobin